MHQRALRRGRLSIKAWLSVALCSALCAAACTEDQLVAAPPSAAGAATLDVSAGPDGQGSAADDLGTGSSAISATVEGPDAGPRVTLSVLSIEDDRLQVQVGLRDIPDLFGVAAHVRVDPALLAIEAVHGHPVLGDTSWEPRTMAVIVGPRVLLGGTRVRSSGSNAAALQGAKVGDQAWATIVLRKLTAEDAVVEFDPERALARSADYAVLKLGWQRLIVRGGGAR